MDSRIGFGGGCHWCTEAIFATIKGVNKVEQGFIKSIEPYNTYSEAVIVRYDPLVIELSDLIEIHLHTHSSTSEHSMREKYRSAVYYFTKDDKEAVQNKLKSLQPQFEQSIITKVLPFVEFKQSLQQYKNYYYADTEKPFCKLYIHPKIQFLKQKYAKLVDTHK